VRLTRRRSDSRGGVSVPTLFLDFSFVRLGDAQIAESPAQRNHRALSSACSNRSIPLVSTRVNQSFATHSKAFLMLGPVAAAACCCAWIPWRRYCSARECIRIVLQRIKDNALEVGMVPPTTGGSRFYTRMGWRRLRALRSSAGNEGGPIRVVCLEEERKGETLCGLRHLSLRLE